MNSIRCILFLIVVTATSTVAFGWGHDNHRATGMIASHYLTSLTSATVKTILSYPPGNNYQTLPEATCWADDIRSDAHYNWAAPWHYVNMPAGAVAYDAVRDCPPEGCVVEGIRHFARILIGTEESAVPAVVINSATSETTPVLKARREALLFLAHFVGDIHQPLHAGHKEDRGGNTIQVEFQRQSINLHALWDYGLTDALRPQWPQYAGELELKITAEQRKKWTNFDPAEWANESHRLVETVVYKVPPDGVIGEAYTDTAMSTVDERMQMAGYRLAIILNAIFDPEWVTKQNVIAETEWLRKKTGSSRKN